MADSTTPAVPPLLSSAPAPRLSPVAALRSRDCEAMSRNCRPMQIGALLIIMALVGSLYSLSASKHSVAVYISLTIGAMLAWTMLYSFCTSGNRTGAWMIALFAPLVVAAFASQIEAFLGVVLRE
jgi:hypothetical protein